MNKQIRLVGLFLISISLAMFIMGIVYTITKNMNYAWIGFGVIYTGAILGILDSKNLKTKLQITNSKIFRKSSIIILVLGLIYNKNVIARTTVMKLEVEDMTCKVRMKRKDI